MSHLSHTDTRVQSPSQSHHNEMHGLSQPSEMKTRDIPNALCQVAINIAYHSTMETKGNNLKMAPLQTFERG